jgi:hypothetical protein
VKADNPKATNLLLRLTNLAVTNDSRRIENYCTEVLAWSCLVSRDFKTKLLQLCAVSEGDYSVHTQFAAKLLKENADPQNQQVYFDLVFESKTDVIVVEVKTWSKFRENQLRDYAAAAKQVFGNRLRKIITITPFAGLPPGSEYNISWGQIQDLLRTTASGSTESGLSVFKQFAEFLKENSLGRMDLHQVTPKNIQSLIAAAPMCEQLFELMRSVGRNPQVAPLFDNGLSKPFLEYSAELKRSWIAIKSQRVPEYYAGISFSDDGQNHLWICLMLHGTYAIPSSRLPKELVHSFNEATALLPSNDQSANFGISKDGLTWFNFAKHLDQGLAERPWETIAWFEDTLLKVKSLVETLTAQPINPSRDD